MSDSPGRVYVLYNAAWPGWVKIGLVFGTELHVKSILESRLSNYNVADPHNGYAVSTSSHAACARVAEQYAHDLFAVHHQRGMGEWFACSLEDAERIVEKACGIARLRPNKRKKHFDAAMDEEQGLTPQQRCVVSRETLAEDYPDLLFCDGFDAALLGVAHRFGMEAVALYDRSKIIEILMGEMTHEEAEDYFSFNVSGAWVGDLTPVFAELGEAR